MHMPQDRMMMGDGMDTIQQGPYLREPLCSMQELHSKTFRKSLEYVGVLRTTNWTSRLKRACPFSLLYRTRELLVKRYVLRVLRFYN